MGENNYKQSNGQAVNLQIYKQLMQLHIRKPNNPIQELGRRPKQAFLQMTKKYMKKCST